MPRPTSITNLARALRGRVCTAEQVLFADLEQLNWRCAVLQGKGDVHGETFPQENGFQQEHDISENSAELIEGPTPGGQAIQKPNQYLHVALWSQRPSNPRMTVGAIHLAGVHLVSELKADHELVRV